MCAWSEAIRVVCEMLFVRTEKPTYEIWIISNRKRTERKITHYMFIFVCLKQLSFLNEMITRREIPPNGRQKFIDENLLFRFVCCSSCHNLAIWINLRSTKVCSFVWNLDHVTKQLDIPRRAIVRVLPLSLRILFGYHSILCIITLFSVFCLFSIVSDDIILLGLCSYRNWISNYQNKYVQSEMIPNFLLLFMRSMYVFHIPFKPVQKPNSPEIRVNSSNVTLLTSVIIKCWHRFAIVLNVRNRCFHARK